MNIAENLKTWVVSSHMNKTPSVKSALMNFSQCQQTPDRITIPIEL